MLLGSHWRARNFGAVFFLMTFAWSPGALAQVRRWRQAGRSRVRGAEDRRRDPRLHGAHRNRGPGGEKLAQAHFNRGKAYAKRSYDAEAIADFNRVIELDPKHAKAYRERGGSYSALAEPTRADADLRRQSAWPPTIPKTTPPEAGFVRERETRNPPRPISSKR